MVRREDPIKQRIELKPGDGTDAETKLQDDIAEVKSTQDELPAEPQELESKIRDAEDNAEGRSTQLRSFAELKGPEDATPKNDRAEQRGQRSEHQPGSGAPPKFWRSECAAEHSHWKGGRQEQKDNQSRWNGTNNEKGTWKG